MAEMDIYMRRRLVALGGLVAFFIIVVLLIRSCGGDEEPAPVTTVGTTDTQGPVTLSRREYIAQADAICAEANAAVGALDPTDPDATADEFDITSDEYAQLRQLQPESKDPTLRDFLAALRDVVDALDSKATAIDRGDTIAEGEAQIAIDEAEVEARSLGEEYGFNDCGQFLDAGQAPAEGGSTSVDPGAVDTGEVPVTPTPTTPAPTTPPAETTTPAPTTPPADDSGGITP